MNLAPVLADIFLQKRNAVPHRKCQQITAERDFVAAGAPDHPLGCPRGVYTEKAGRFATQLLAEAKDRFEFRPSGGSMGFLDLPPEVVVLCIQILNRPFV